MERVVYDRIKATVEAGLARGGVATLLRRRRRDDLLILAYHNVAPRGADPVGDSGLHLPEDVFAEQLDRLQETHDIVPLATALEPDTGEPHDRPRAAITFDDAYRGAVTTAVQHLARRRLPATIFVAPAFVGDRSFWWDALVKPGEATLPDGVREAALSGLAGLDADIRRWGETIDRPPRQMPDHARCADFSELLRAVQTGWITLGSHTWSHSNLTRLDDATAEQELARPLAWLRDRFVASVPILSYPYGRSSAHIERLAARVGYVAALRVEGGWMHPGEANLYALPRFNVPAGLSADGLTLRAAGLWCR